MSYVQTADPAADYSRFADDADDESAALEAAHALALKEVRAEVEAVIAEARKSPSMAPVLKLPVESNKRETTANFGYEVGELSGLSDAFWGLMLKALCSGTSSDIEAMWTKFADLYMDEPAVQRLVEMRMVAILRGRRLV